MRAFRKIVLLLAGLAAVATAIYLTGNYEALDRLKDWLWAVQLSWPSGGLDFEELLVVLLAISWLIAALLFIACTTLFAALITRAVVTRQHRIAQVSSAQGEVEQLKERYHADFEQLMSLEQTLAKRLDKRVMVQAIVEAASRMTSVVQANSIVSLWLLHPETDTFRFELGRYCDETFFVKTEFHPTEQPFAHVIASQKIWLLAEERERASFIKPEKASQLGSATNIIVVPFVIEGRVLGLLLVFCHPEIARQYETRQVFYSAVWAQLTLGVVIAIQGAVTILDRLTGVHTREYFMNRLIQEIERANRFQLPLSLLMIDIDNFKAVNDMLGHPQGDAVLRIIAKIIRKEVRVIDLVGRYGGEEFIVMLPETGYGEDSTSATGALLVAERIRKSVDDEFQELQKPLNLTVSLGVAIRRFPEDREGSYRDLIRIADEQLYRAKTSGKNKVCTPFSGAP